MGFGSDGVRLGARLALTVGLAVFASFGPMSAELSIAQSGLSQPGPTPASVRIVRGVAITPTAANTFYNPSSALTHTDGLCSEFAEIEDFDELCDESDVQHRAPEIIELARALQGGSELNLADPAQIREHVDLTYEYVHRRIDTEFLFGSYKGALGTLIDGSGTAFDQANLMVQILRQSGLDADFVYGTITLTASEFEAWTGLTRADAVCDFLALGGIPFSTVGGCTGSGSPGDVQLAHVWVRASVNGQTLDFDPALKTYDHIDGLDVRTIANLPGSVLGEAVGSGSGSTDGSGVYTAAAFTPDDLSDALGAGAERLRQRLDDEDLSGASMVEVVGGRILQSTARPSGGWGVASLSGHTQVAAWDGAEGIPDQFRARITLFAEYGEVTAIDVGFFTDEIYGRRLELSGRPDPLALSSLTAEWSPILSFDGIELLEAEGQYGVVAMNLTLELGADHPFAAQSGAYGDSTGTNAIEKIVNFLQPASIVHGWGATSGELAAKWDREQGQDRPNMISIAAPPSTDDLVASLSNSSGDLLRARIGATWLSQFSMARDLHAELAEARAIHLHTLGVVSSLNHAVPLPGAYNPAPGMGSGFSIQDEVTVVDLETSFGLVSRVGDATARRAAVHAIAATAATLEGSVVGQLTDSPDAVSTASRFAWGAAPASGDYDTGQRSVLGLPAGFSTGFYSQTRYDNSTGSPAAYGGLVAVSSGTAQGLRNNLEDAILSYTDDDFQVVASAEANLGPGHRHGSEMAEWSITIDGGSTTTVSHNTFCQMNAAGSYSGTVANEPECQVAIGGSGQWVTELSISVGEEGRERTITGYARLPTLQRGGALIATRYAGAGVGVAGDADDPLEIAHVLTRWGPAIKGGGGPSVTQGQRFDPNSAADVLADRFQDRSSALGVSNGAVGYSTPVLEAIGAGEFPYRLEHALAIRGGAARPANLYGDSTEPLVVSSLDGDATVSSSGREAMGASRPEAAASTIVAFIAMQDVWAEDRSAEREVAGVLVADWWASRIVGNLLTIFQGGDATPFIRVAFPADNLESGVDQRLFRAPGGPATAVLSDDREAVRPEIVNASARPQLGRTDPANRQLESTVRMWTYPEGTSLTLTGSGADERSYTYAGALEEGEEMGFEPRHERFWLASWTFPQGVELTYDRTGGGVTVASNMGYELDLTHVGDDLDLHDVFLASAALQSTCYDPSLALSYPTARFQAANAEGEISRVEFARRVGRTATQRPTSLCQVEAVFSPDDLLTPSVLYYYDRVGRIMAAQDAVSIRSPGARGSHRFYVADGYRNARRDALGALYAVETMNDGRLSRHIDELGRVTTSGFDGRGRAISRLYPEGNSQEFSYDERDNITLMRQIARPGGQCTTGEVVTQSPVMPSWFVRDDCEDIVVTAEWHTEFNKPLWIQDRAPDGDERRTDFTYYELNDSSEGAAPGMIFQVRRPAPVRSDPDDRPTWQFKYNELGQIDEMFEPNQNTTTYTYDANHHLIQTTTGWASYTQRHLYFLHDARGRLIESWNGVSGSAHAYVEYDEMDRPIRESRGTGADRWERQTDYDAAGRVIEVRQRLGETSGETWAVTRTGYTATGQPWWVEDPDGDTALTEYDAMDRRISVTDPTGIMTRFAYDAAGQLLSEVRGYVPGACSTTPGDTADADCGQFHALYGYTPNGQQAWIRDGRRQAWFATNGGLATAIVNNTASFEYDGHGRVMRTSFPTGLSPSYNFEELVYGASGQVERRRTREGLIVDATFDNLDRMLTRVEMDVTGADRARTPQSWRAYDAEFEYDLAGRMRLARTFVPSTHATQLSRTWAYDGAGVGDPTSHTRSTTGGDFTYLYDSAGALVSVGHGGGVFGTYGYDAHGRMETANLVVGGSTVGTASIDYDTMDRRTLVTFGDGSTQSYAWEIGSDLVGMEHAYPGDQTDDVAFDWEHDALGRVTSEEIDHEAYDYEAATGTCTYGAATAINTYPSACGLTISYADSTNPQTLEADGAIHRDGIWRYRYDGHGNLRDAYRTVSSGPPAIQEWTRHSVDALGERYYSVHYIGTGQQTAFWSYSDGLRPEVVSEPTRSRPTDSGSWTTGGTRTWVLGPMPDERLIYRDDTGAVFYPHTDRRGSTIAVSQGAPNQGQVVQTYAYDEFGRGSPSDGIGGYPYRYTGQRLDPHTGTYHYKAREYAPNLGRFLQPDPARFVDGPNMYAYVGNNPWNGTDPTGMRQYQARRSWSYQYGGPWGGWRGIDPYASRIESWNSLGRSRIGESFVPYQIVGRGTEQAVTAARDNFARQQARDADRRGFTLGASEPGARYQTTIPATNARGEVTSRPSGLRRSTLEEIWNSATPGSSGGRECPTCGVEVLVRPFSGQRRDWDGDHINPPWISRAFPPGVQRPQVLDNYNQGVRLRCPSCNRSGSSE